MFMTKPWGDESTVTSGQTQTIYTIDQLKAFVQQTASQYEELDSDY